MRTRTTLVAALSGLAIGAVMIGAAPEIKHEMGADRAALTEIEGRPIADAIGSLTDWSHRGVMDPSNTEGKVVVLALVSAQEPKSWMTISKLTRLQREFERQGIVIAAIHPDIGWEMMQEKIDAGRVAVPVARDEGGAFAQAMGSDDYPDLYVIDRAGNLRFADVDQRSIEDAISTLVKEDTALAMSNAQLQREGKAIVAPEPVAPTVTAADYKNAPWPEPNAREITAKNFQGQALPHKVGENEDWVDNERDLEGKVLVLDFWATWCGPCRAAAPMLEEMQDDYEGRLEIVGIGGSEPKSDFVKYVMKKDGNYAQMFDEKRTLNSAMEVRAIPHVVVVSTDGVVRWQGNPHDPAFKSAVAQTIAADPMLAQ